jgi:hypothetical protein
MKTDDSVLAEVVLELREAVGLLNEVKGRIAKLVEIEKARLSADEFCYLEMMGMRQIDV